MHSDELRGLPGTSLRLAYDGFAAGRNLAPAAVATGMKSDVVSVVKLSAAQQAADHFKRVPPIAQEAPLASTFLGICR